MSTPVKLLKETFYLAIQKLKEDKQIFKKWQLKNAFKLLPDQ